MKRSINSPFAEARRMPLLILLALVAFIHGCARLPYGPAIIGDEQSEHRKDFIGFSSHAAECAPCFDGEILVNWTHPMNSINFSGYFQTRLPSYLRFSILNPFGQPVYAVASDGTTFQYVDTIRRIFTAGNLASYSMINDISPIFLSGPWGAWLSARPTFSSILEIHEDPDRRGIWYSVADTPTSTSANELLLLDETASRMLERAILGRNGKIEATISYGNWQLLDGCEQPLDISFTGLAYGAKARLKLSDVRSSEAVADVFKIEAPAGYKRRLIP